MKKKIIKIIILIVGFAGLICFINFIPALSLKSSGMSVIDGKWVNVYYEKEKDAATDTFHYADAETERIARKLGFSEKINYSHPNCASLKNITLFCN